MFEGLSFLSPWSAVIAGGVLLPAVVALYFLKLRRKRLVVSSTLLWKKAIHDMQVNAPFQKMRRNLLLLLQLLLLILLLLALAQPTREGMASLSDRYVILIDCSGSMNAADVAPTRLEKAKELALDEIEAYDGAGGIMVVAFAQSPQVMCAFTTDKNEVRQAIESIRPTDQQTNLAPAWRLVEPYATDAAGQGSLGVLTITDGRFADADDLPRLEGVNLEFVRVGRSEQDQEPNNVAIVALSARRDYEKPQMVEIYAELANYSTREVVVNVALSIDGEDGDLQGITVPGVSTTTDAATGLRAPGRRGVQFPPFELGSGALIGLRHDAEDDVAADDAAYINIAPPRHVRALLVTAKPAPLADVLDAIGLRKLEVMDPQTYDATAPNTLVRSATNPDEGFDVIVFDNHSPQTVPPVDSLYFNSRPPIEGLKLAASNVEGRYLVHWERDDPLLRYVALDDVLIWETSRLVVPPEGEVLAMGVDGPAMARVAHEGLRHVIVAFDVRDSGWPLHVSFPAFFQNVIQYLAVGREGSSTIAFEAGDVAVIKQIGDGVDEIRYAGPVTLEAPVQKHRALLPIFERVGLYTTRQPVAPGWDRLPVNMASIAESDTRAMDWRGSDEEDGPGNVLQTAGTSFRQGIWWWAALAGLGMLMIEWIVYTRRMEY